MVDEVMIDELMGDGEVKVKVMVMVMLDYVACTITTSCTIVKF